MKGLRKKIAMVFLIIVMGVTPVFANMPVIDITAIAQAIQGYVQSIQEWNAQIQQWKSEFDRIQKAAKGLASGDFTQIVSSIASLSKQASNWKVGSTLLDDAYLDRAFDAVGDGSYSILSLLNNSQIMVKNFKKFIDIIERNADKMEMAAAINNSQNGLEAVGAVGSGTTEILSNMVTMMTNLIKSGGNIAMDISGIWNDMATIFNVSPTEYAKIYKDILTETLASSTGNSNVKKSEDVLKLIEEQQTIALTARREQANINSSESPNAYNQAQLEIDTAEKLAKEYEELYVWATQMESAIKEIESKEATYKEKVDAQDTAKKRTKAALEMQSNMSEYREEQKIKEAERQQFIDKIANGTLGLQRQISSSKENGAASNLDKQGIRIQ